MLGVNPGSSEIRDQPDEVQQALRNRGDVDLLTLNDEELRQLFRDGETPLEKLVLRATTLATHVLCTRGSEGAMWGYNGEVLSAGLDTYNIELLHPDDIEDTLGAGDCANEAATRAIAEGYPPEYALEQAVTGPLPLLAVVGAHGHIPLHD
ncbi:MAG: carbohydrate kinase family protein, partial [Candidatus Saccharimonadales bacterium]